MPWHSIAECKGTGQNCHGVICGTGPTGDWLDRICESYPGAIKIAINKAIVLRDDFDYLFVVIF